MKNELKKKWIEALLSNNYKKGTSRFRNLNNEFCCLGVLCDVVDKNSWREVSVLYQWKGLAYYFDSLQLHTLGLSEFDQSELMILNDTNNGNFINIAAWIEENIPVSD